MADINAARRGDLKPSIALYSAGFLTLFSAILAVNSTVYVSGFAAAAAGIAAAGHLISWSLRRKGYTLRLLEIVVIGVVIIIYAKVAAGEAANELIMPSAAQNSMELKLAVLLLWMEVFRTFTLTSDYAVVFTAVPAVALLGLMATENINPEMLLFFVIYLVSAVFMLVHRSSAETSHVCGDEKRLLGEQVRAALAVGALAMAAGTVVVTPLRMASAGVFAKMAPGWMRASPRVGLQNLAEPGMLQIAQGPVRLSAATVMVVRSNPPGKLVAYQGRLYWRGRVFDQYTGHGWISSSNYHRAAPMNKPNPGSVNRDNEEINHYQYRNPSARNEPYNELEQLFEVSRSSFSTVYAASEAKTLKIRSDHVWRDDENNWRAAFGTSYPIKYQVVSVVPQYEAAKLRRAGTNYPREITARYLQRSNRTIRTAELAMRLTAGLKNPYDKAYKIADYLSSNYTYDINAAPAPMTSDAVEHFLFSSRTGYCDVFASAMVVMLRELGIPSRLATGYAEGTYDPEIQGMRVRELDRHAWVEVYFPEYGWIPFDPTGGSQTGDLTWYQEAFRTAQVSFRMLTSSGMITVALLLLLITLGLFILNGPGNIRFLTRRLPSRKAAPSRVHLDAVREFNRMCRRLEKKGIRMESWVTPQEYASLAAEKLPGDEPAGVIRRITDTFNTIRYSDTQTAQSELEIMRSDLRRLRRLLK